MSSSIARKQKMGIVVSNKMQKTIVVKTERLTKHAKYNKIIKQYKKIKAHDEKNQAKIGDKVLIEETRPLSKDKRFRLIEVLK
ncbi:MAG: 30S ribosomal protein S17 [Candidatus Omnitrophota bacterium]